MEYLSKVQIRLGVETPEDRGFNRDLERLLLHPLTVGINPRERDNPANALLRRKLLFSNERIQAGDRDPIACRESIPNMDVVSSHDLKKVGDFDSVFERGEIVACLDTHFELLDAYADVLGVYLGKGKIAVTHYRKAYPERKRNPLRTEFFGKIDREEYKGDIYITDMGKTDPSRPGVAYKVRLNIRETDKKPG